MTITKETKTKGPAQWEDVEIVKDKDIGMYIGIESDYLNNETLNWLKMGSFPSKEKTIPKPDNLTWYLHECSFENDFKRYLSNIYQTSPSVEIEKSM